MKMKLELNLNKSNFSKKEFDYFNQNQVAAIKYSTLKVPFGLQKKF